MADWSTTQSDKTPGRALELESALADQLRRVRLVAEIGVDAPLRAELAGALREIVCRTRDPGRISRLYPATLVTYMVAEGIYGYEAGAYFSNQTVHQVDHSFSRPTVNALRTLGLETFDDLVAQEKARPYLTPILAHGGIPKYCLGDFFALLLHDLGRGVTDANDLLTLWRTRKTRFQGIDKPVERFLLYGGELAVDLIDRCVDLVREYSRTGAVPLPQDLGLPPYVVEAFAELPEKKPRATLRTSTALPRPRLMIDPWDPRGPTLELPPVPISVTDAAWLVQGADQPRRYAATRGEPRLVLMRPARSWSCELSSGSVVARRSNFEGLDPVPAVFFNPHDGQAVNVATGLRLSEAWILAPASTEISAISSGNAVVALSSPQELPQPAGDWSGFTLVHVDLQGVRTLVVKNARDETIHRVRVLSPAERPELSGSVLAGVTTDDGLPVYASPPAISLGRSELPAEYWRIRLRHGASLANVNAADLPADESGLRVDSLLTGGPERIDLVVQGPLGSDLRTAFAIVPALEVHRPARIFCPGDPEIAVTVTAGPTVAFPSTSEAGVARLAVADDSDHASCVVHGSSDTRLTLRIRVNRLLWGVTRSDDPATALGDTVDIVPADQLVDGTASALVVRTGVDGARVALRLDEATGQIQRCEDVCTSGSDGRWIFDLARFRDSVRASAEPRLHLRLTVEGRTVDVAEIRAALDLGPILVHSRVQGDFCAVNLEFEEHRPLRNRVARLWSLDRPWEGPITEPIADGHTGSAELSGYSRIPPGRYRAEVAIDDGWLTPSRPRAGSPNTVTTRVGTADDANERLRALEKNDDPFALLEVATATGLIGRQLEADELSKVAGAALDAACTIIDEEGVAATTSRKFRALCDLLFAEPVCLIQAIVDDAAELKHSPETLLIFCIENVHRVRPLPMDGADEGLRRSLWLAAPVLAAGMEIDTEIAAEQAARCEEFLGWAPETGCEAIPTGAPVDQVMVGIDAEQLEAIQRSIELVPRQLLSLDALVLSNFEWLLAEKHGTAQPDRWWSDANALIDRLVVPTEQLARHLDARHPAN